MSNRLKTLLSAFKEQWSPSKNNNTRIYIKAIERSARTADGIAGFELDAPCINAAYDTYTMTIAGRLNMEQQTPLKICIRNARRILRHISLQNGTHSVERNENQYRFHTAISCVGLPQQTDLVIEVKLDNGAVVLLCQIKLQHEPLESAFQPVLQPVVISALARSGTTWLMRLLAAHPQIVVAGDYPYEILAALYWLHMLKVLTEPAHHEASTPIRHFSKDMHSIGHHPFHGNPLKSKDMQHWFGTEYPQGAAAFCQWSIDAFYLQQAELQQCEASFFAEKFVMDDGVTLCRELYPESREIILVRDFRDTLASVIAFNKKRGFDRFGRQFYDSDEDYIREELQQNANKLLQRCNKRDKHQLLVRYEDLIHDPVAEYSRIARFISVDCDDTLIKQICADAQRPTDNSRRHQTASQSTIGRWRQDLDPHLQEVCQEALGDVLDAFGYA